MIDLTRDEALEAANALRQQAHAEAVIVRRRPDLRPGEVETVDARCRSLADIARKIERQVEKFDVSKSIEKEEG